MLKCDETDRHKAEGKKKKKSDVEEPIAFLQTQSESNLCRWRSRLAPFVGGDWLGDRPRACLSVEGRFSRRFRWPTCRWGDTLHFLCANHYSGVGSELDKSGLEPTPTWDSGVAGPQASNAGPHVPVSHEILCRPWLRALRVQGAPKATLSETGRTSDVGKITCSLQRTELLAWKKTKKPVQESVCPKLHWCGTERLPVGGLVGPGSLSRSGKPCPYLVHHPRQPASERWYRCTEFSLRSPSKWWGCAGKEQEHKKSFCMSCANLSACMHDPILILNRNDKEWMARVLLCIVVWHKFAVNPLRNH